MALPASYEEIATLLDEQAFEKSSIEKLQAYLDEQIATETYDFVANKALLKLYSFYPDQASDQYIALALTKALMALPSTDMMLLLYLVPESAQTKEPVATLVRCAVHLETAKFVEFWEVANLGGNELLDAVSGFDEAIRSYMIGVLSITFQKVESETFADLLALDEGDLEEYVSANQSDKLSIEGKNVVFTPNSENQQRPKKFKENISFDQMLPLIDFLASS
uniref:Eukaryotic translation initiation factor 3 subunit K n=1 Tax=Florenciella parvula TaxID=236787 RepID=A0A7S2FZN4_9STRA|mmetsp:Transcript_2768/g.6041  ORF Transcript_2768/g.6041 Transcript_2768/m.6041 type:complete len:222 (+) Transcript_2768:37-702(+)|eukprot:CAMPEP_0182538666 /NCGR_PEP_ID=MMETSP1323-20130603/24059_1 /TAXON_ID=236787 /ORGANISM="Florenciella parvula, Strain RCC1693" /LENGTH=221 /DNA_ID=CAMNT_0024749151 /DNA_START=37 /DNA_END=702 /DNA_ORIENTATION=+